VNQAKVQVLAPRTSGRGHLVRLFHSFTAQAGAGPLLLMFLAAVTLALLPVSSQQSTLEWTGRSTTSGNPVVLAVAPLEALTVEVPCQPAIEMATPDYVPQRVFGTSGMADSANGIDLTIDPSAVYWGSVNAETSVQIPVELGYDCRIVATYGGPDKTLTLSIANKSSTTDGAFPETANDSTSIGPVTTAFWTADSVRPGTRVQAILHPSTVDWPAWRWLIVALAAACLYLAVRAQSPGLISRAARLARRLRPDRIDVVLLIPLLLSWLSTPPFYDDGWVLVTNREFPNVGFFSNYYTVAGAPQAQGFWWSFIERLWLFPDSPVLLMRFPSVLIAWFTWILVRKGLLARLTPAASSRTVVVIGLSVAILNAVSWLPALRPEVVITALLALQLVLFVRTRAWTPVRLTAQFSLTALGMALHQTGFMLVSTSIVALLVSLRPAASGKRNWAGALWASVAGVSVLVVALMLHASVATLAWSSSAFTSESGHNHFLDELERALQFVVSTDYARTWMASLVVLSVAAFVLRRDRSAEPARTVGWLAVGSLSMLLFTSSKWEGHFGAVWVPVVLLTGSAIAASWDRLCAKRTLLVVTATAVGISALAMTITGKGSFLSFTPWPSSPAGNGSRIASLLVLFAVLGCSAWLAKPIRSICPPVIPAVATNLLVALLAVLAAFVTVDPGQAARVQGRTPAFTGAFADSSSPDFSWHEILRSECGLANVIQVVPNPISLTPDWQLTSDISTNAFGGPRNQTGLLRPVPGVAIYEPVQDGRAITPWFIIGQATSVQWWSEALSDQTSMTVEYLDLMGKPLQTEVLERTGTAGTWQLYRVDVPMGASVLRLSYVPGIDRVATTTGPVDASSTASARQVVYGSVWRNPDEVLLYPCAPMPSIASGTFEEFPWALGIPAISPSGPTVRPLQTEAQMVEHGCATSNAGRTTCLFKIEYPVGVKPTLTRTSVLVR